MKFTTTFLYLILLALPANSQELKKITERKENSPVYEEYYVLKEDKSIKHGKYIKYFERLAVEKYIREFGSYEQNQKNGIWFLFNITHPQNPLSIVGEYSNGEKTGQWFYFYRPELKDSSIFFLLGRKKLTEVIPPKRKGQEFQITIDTTGIRLAATGNFERNKKVGKWSYYSQDGQLTKEYDFTVHKLIYNSRNDSASYYLPGGITHFEEELTQVLLEDIHDMKSFGPSKATIEVISNSNSVFVNNLTAKSDDPFSELIKNLVQNMPGDWVNYDPIFEKFTFIFEISLGAKENQTHFDIGSVRPKYKKD